MESRMPGNLHVRFGKRRNETDRRKPTRRVAPTSPWLFEPATIAASMAIVSRRRSTTHPQGRSTAEDGGGETFLAREEWAPPGPRACGVASPGEESLAAAIAARRSRLCRPAARSRHQEAAGVARQTALQGEDVADMVRARGQAQRAKEQKPWRTERRSQPSGISPCARIADTGFCRLRTAVLFDRCACEGRVAHGQI